MSKQLLIYGATGYSGRLMAQKARQLGLPVVLAGRSVERTKRAAESLGLPWRAVALDAPRQLDAALANIAVVLHAAGPFIATAGAMMQACLRTGTHYLDIAGELPVFQEAERRDKQARRDGIMLMPGAGFLIVASDCLAAHVARRLPRARYLRLAMNGSDIISRGSLRSVLGIVRETVSIRRAGKLTTVPVGQLRHPFDFGHGERWATAVSAADVVTAWHTTGIPNIAAYAHFAPAVAFGYHAGALFAEPLRLPPVQAAINALAGVWPEGPSAAKRGATRHVIVAEAEDAWLRTMRARLTSPDGYSCTPDIALGIAARVLAGDFREGFQTPARLYGADLILAVDGARRDDLDDALPGSSRHSAYDHATPASGAQT